MIATLVEPTVAVSEKIAYRIKSDLESLKQLCDDADKSISRYVRHSSLDQTEVGRKLSRDYRKRVLRMRREIEEESSAVLQLPTVPASRLRSLYSAFGQSKSNLETIDTHFKGDFQKATHFHHWSRANTSELTMVDEDPRNPLLSSSRPCPQGQYYPTGAPYDAQFSYVPRRAEQPPAKKKGFFSRAFSSSDTSDSDDAQPVRPPVLWGPMM